MEGFELFLLGVEEKINKPETIDATPQGLRGSYFEGLKETNY